jgi:hypothetical protein
MDERVHTYLHCRECLMLQNGQATEIGITGTGLLVNCPKHGRVIFFTPEILAEWISRGPQCDCCRGGKHRHRRRTGGST